MYAGLNLIIPPASEPVSVADAKLHSHIDIDADDGQVAGYLSAARQYCENRTNRALLTQTWRLALRQWPGRNYSNSERPGDHNDGYYKYNHIELPRPPLQSITTFTYTDTTGVIAPMAQGYGSAIGNYLLDTESEPGRIYLPFSGLWPTTILAPGVPILITYKAGYPSFSGMVTVASDGKTVNWASGDRFAPALAGTFIQVGEASSTIGNIASDATLTLMQAVASGPAAYSANAVPHTIKQAILFLAAHFYENREMVVVGRTAQIATEVPFTVTALLADYRNFHPIQAAA